MLGLPLQTVVGALVVVVGVLAYCVSFLMRRAMEDDKREELRQARETMARGERG